MRSNDSASLAALASCSPCHERSAMGQPSCHAGVEPSGLRVYFVPQVGARSCSQPCASSSTLHTQQSPASQRRPTRADETVLRSTKNSTQSPG